MCVDRVGRGLLEEEGEGGVKVVENTEDEDTCVAFKCNA